MEQPKRWKISSSQRHVSQRKWPGLALCVLPYSDVFSRLQSTSLYRRNELRMGPLVAHHQTVFVTVGRRATRRSTTTTARTNIVAEQQSSIAVSSSVRLPMLQRVLVVQGRVPTVMRLGQTKSRLDDDYDFSGGDRLSSGKCIRVTNTKLRVLVFFLA